MPEVWTVKNTLDWCQEYLQRHGDENPRLSAQWLMSHATGLSRVEIYTNYERPLSTEERDVLRDALRRRGSGEPLQYIQGSAPFRFIEVKVRPGVLIPRPETEVLVDEAMRELKSIMPDAFTHRTARDSMSVDGEEPVPAEAFKIPTFNVVDACTGSGCIACAIASEHANAQVVATDVSETAVELARENAADLGLGDRIEVRLCDLLADAEDSWADLIVSNPPYVPTAVVDSEIPAEVADFEPRLALDGGEDGLDIYRRLLADGKRVLKADGILACELHETCLEEAARLAEEAHYTQVRIAKDLAGRPRIIVAHA
ncbi:Release factor glutamine methyltransferase [Slackia heliotrinireducens]|uniref:Release factor glutamine methyltransferase n=1 Tax=Slackia heliotrinireducens (strain ATCC 29202 / DSM 20476 / NCTC 11029 / RHS 1) TaxID=471855 RepID=C7N6B0_SLAHD|nr:peptide chain release factor N(5)-glutamine methyltransferase [Slackia heliotrinireducens]ACV22445.1 protein-(glutamine-N5) methyltransferase, release factor-specific [Slackia heliotrinireducens DSM 20476]VEH00802.1 Release factor glutamine methyltransferase [Slackia heliotrinireducens]